MTDAGIDEATTLFVCSAIIASITMLPRRPRAWLRKYGGHQLLIGTVPKHLIDDYREAVKEAMSLSPRIKPSQLGHLLSVLRIDTIK